MNKPLIIVLLVSFALLHGFALYIRGGTPRGAEPDAAAMSFKGD